MRRNQEEETEEQQAQAVKPEIPYDAGPASASVEVGGAVGSAGQEDAPCTPPLSFVKAERTPGSSVSGGSEAHRVVDDGHNIPSSGRATSSGGLSRRPETLESVDENVDGFPAPCCIPWSVDW